MPEPDNDASPDTGEDALTTDEILGHLETGLWTAVVLIPVFYYINGPSVSHDQFVVRSVLAGVTYVGAPLMRFYRWRRGKRVNSDR